MIITFAKAVDNYALCDKLFHKNHFLSEVGIFGNSKTRSYTKVFITKGDIVNEIFKY